ncbi:uncharacterized protein LOC117645430 isoform X2 [Thrips palmi]|uniref:Uncharacterized protein LOC117645430 isoform X2 n=1 Tax=Thrips palmi TaxID=161013 RepID=A0A6P8YW89_THRPL|nr:uncharacterized protein LOC117645430 isoform X2 [Thrips palmi]
MSLSSGGDVEGGVNGKKSENGAPTLKVFRRRWLVLAAFCFLSLLNGFQWVQYAIVSDSVARYYGVSLQAVDWASMVYMLMYVPFVAPASWMLDKKGLRHTVVLAAVLNCLAAWVKVASGRPDLYAVTMVGQAVAAVTQAFVLAVPARLAAVWFGAGEVATACAIGVFGNQVGNAFGFLLPPLVVKNQEDVDELGSELRTVYYGVAAATTLSLLIILLGRAPRAPQPLASAVAGLDGVLRPAAVYRPPAPHPGLRAARRHLRHQRGGLLRHQHRAQPARQHRLPGKQRCWQHRVGPGGGGLAGLHRLRGSPGRYPKIQGSNARSIRVVRRWHDCVHGFVPGDFHLGRVPDKLLSGIFSHGLPASWLRAGRRADVPRARGDVRRSAQRVSSSVRHRLHGAVRAAAGAPERRRARRTPLGQRVSERRAAAGRPAHRPHTENAAQADGPSGPSLRQIGPPVFTCITNHKKRKTRRKDIKELISHGRDSFFTKLD